jgi:hypothetical protein
MLNMSLRKPELHPNPGNATLEELRVAMEAWWTSGGGRSRSEGSIPVRVTKVNYTQ